MGSGSEPDGGGWAAPPPPPGLGPAPHHPRATRSAQERGCESEDKRAAGVSGQERRMSPKRKTDVCDSPRVWTDAREQLPCPRRAAGVAQLGGGWGLCRLRGAGAPGSRNRIKCGREPSIPTSARRGPAGEAGGAEARVWPAHSQALHPRRWLSPCAFGGAPRGAGGRPGWGGQPPCPVSQPRGAEGSPSREPPVGPGLGLEQWGPWVLRPGCRGCHWKPPS